ncbi:extracellular solute-binding protein [Aureibacillus halotolerans]|uniref:Putative aldouronate transport system substrate-binding protein n=1 Tax=Aureibacillus halotolerans TaxID=1508390 RepID=A0A4R6TRA5_9BACI|nr:extracellular solute-binding protein [Aureibacillus halotolerans]TDQ36080.1 putative aldouronate transport system substrate-binding protein [Aureibacillus halotolerans]
MKRKVVSSLVGAALLLSACSGQQAAEENTVDVTVNPEGFPIVDEQLTLSMFGPSAGAAEWEDMHFFQEMAERTNIQFDFTTPALESIETQKNLMFASGDYPGIIFGGSLTTEEQVDYGSQGILLPLNDLIEEHAPNIQKMFEEFPEIEKTVTATDGNIYALPNVNQGIVWARGPLWYNNAWLEALDVEELPSTTDEMYDLLMRFKTEDPNGNGEADEIPLTAYGIEDIRQWFLGAFGHLDPSVEVIDGEVMLGAIQPGYKGYLEYMHKLYTDGLLDPESFSQTAEQKTGKGKANRLGLFANWFPHFTLGGPDDSTDNPMMRAIKSDMVDEPVLPKSDGVSVGQFAITNANPSPEASIRWIDYLYSEEGATLLNIGEEGLFWEWADDSETVRVHKETPDQYTNAEEWRSTLTPDYGVPTPKRAFPDLDLSWKDNTFTKFIFNETEEKFTPYAQVPIPELFLTKEEQGEVSRIRADLDAFVEQMEAKFITGQRPLSEWDDYVATIEDMNAARLVEIYADAYARYNGE